MGETLGKAVIDTGCPNTVTGMEWLNSYIDTLSCKDRKSIYTSKSKNRYRFGSGDVYPSKYNIIIPIYVGQKKHRLAVDVVDCKIPLLLSSKTLTRANAKIDLKQATICFLETTVKLNVSSSGHLCLSLSRPLDTQNEETQKVLTRVLFSSQLEGVATDLRNKIRKLHLQFCHPAADHLIDLIKSSGVNDENVFDLVKIITSQCDVCIRCKKMHLRACSNEICCQDDHVYYCRNDKADCHRPAVVDYGQQMLLKHSRTCVKFHPCRMQQCPAHSTSLEPASSGCSSTSPVADTSDGEEEHYATADEDDNETKILDFAAPYQGSTNQAAANQLQSSNANDKRVSFKNAKWKIKFNSDDTDDEADSNEVYYNDCKSVFAKTKMEEPDRWKLLCSSYYSNSALKTSFSQHRKCIPSR